MTHLSDNEKIAKLQKAIEICKKRGEPYDKLQTGVEKLLSIVAPSIEKKNADESAGIEQQEKSIPPTINASINDDSVTSDNDLLDNVVEAAINF